MREHLIASGLETLHRQGFSASAVQDITDAAGLPKGSFYNYFESKEALALEVIDRFGKEQGALGGVLSDESISPVERLRRYFTSLAANSCRVRTTSEVAWSAISAPSSPIRAVQFGIDSPRPSRPGRDRSRLASGMRKRRVKSRGILIPARLRISCSIRLKGRCCG